VNAGSNPDSKTTPGAPGTRPELADLRVGLTELFAAERRMRGREKRHPGELTLTQSIALIPIYLGHEATAGELANAAGLNPASVTAMLDQLEKSAIVKRKRSKSDRRVVLVTLTDKGRAAQDAMRAQWDKRWFKELADIPDEDLAVTLRTIRKVSRMLDQANS
jgi:DNA-binding MarR family transcriptional regulator